MWKFLLLRLSAKNESNPPPALPVNRPQNSEHLLLRRKSERESVHNACSALLNSSAGLEMILPLVGGFAIVAQQELEHLQQTISLVRIVKLIIKILKRVDRRDDLRGSGQEVAFLTHGWQYWRQRWRWHWVIRGRRARSVSPQAETVHLVYKQEINGEQRERGQVI